MMDEREARETPGEATSSALLAIYRKLRSVVSVSSTPGFNTLMTTSRRDPFKIAEWTCAMDADARGITSTLSKMSSKEQPRSCSMVLRTVAKGTDGVWSRHF